MQIKELSICCLFRKHYIKWEWSSIIKTLIILSIFLIKIEVGQCILQMKRNSSIFSFKLGSPKFKVRFRQYCFRNLLFNSHSVVVNNQAYTMWKVLCKTWWEGYRYESLPSRNLPFTTPEYLSGANTYRTKYNPASRFSFSHLEKREASIAQLDSIFR